MNTSTGNRNQMEGAGAASPTTPSFPWTWGNRLLGYDREHRRLWIGGQRLHHGVTGIVVATTGLMRIARRRRDSLHRAIAWTLAGGALVAHDWKDRSVWFRRGSQSD